MKLTDLQTAALSAARAMPGIPVDRFERETGIGTRTVDSLIARRLLVVGTDGGLYAV